MHKGAQHSTLYTLPCRICLVASCPGGTASNVVTFLANADVALSVMMTTVSTFAAVVMTPLLTKTLVGAMVPVDAKALFVSTLQVDRTLLQIVYLLSLTSSTNIVSSIVVLRHVHS